MLKLVILSSVLASVGCGGICIDPPSPPTPSPGWINHVVLFDLQDPADADELIDDCYELLQSPWASAGYVGKHYDIGRDTVRQDYDVALIVAFDSEQAYRNYLQFPTHISLVEKWKPRWDSIRVYDIGDVRLIDWQTQKEAERNAAQ